MKEKESHFGVAFFSTVRVLEHCHRLPREAVQSLSLEIFKPQLGMAQSNVSVADTALSRGLDLTTSRDAFQPQLLCGSKQLCFLNSHKGVVSF